MNPTKFDNLFDLARLPYFEMRQGRLMLADPALGPVVDCHTHLALSYGPRPPKVDLLAETPNVERYLRVDKPIDFDVYMNKNFAPHDLHAIERDMTKDTFGPGGMRATHTLPNLMRHMSDVGVTQSLLLPIDFPFWSKNSESWLGLTAGKGEIVCFGSVHPFQPRMRQKVSKLAEMGARGLKFHPAVQLVGPDEKRAMKLYRVCAEYKLPILFHCGPVDIETRIGRRHMPGAQVREGDRREPRRRLRARPRGRAPVRGGHRLRAKVPERLLRDREPEPAGRAAARRRAARGAAHDGLRLAVLSPGMVLQSLAAPLVVRGVPCRPARPRRPGLLRLDARRPRI